MTKNPAPEEPGIFQFAEFLDLLADRAEASGALDDFKLATANIHRLFGIISRERTADIQKAEEDGEGGSGFNDLVNTFVDDVREWRDSDDDAQKKPDLRTILIRIKPTRRLAWKLICNDQTLHTPAEEPCPGCEGRAKDIHALLQEALRLGVIKRRGPYVYFSEMNLGHSDFRHSYSYSNNVKRVAGDSNLEFELRTAVAKAKQVSASDVARPAPLPAAKKDGRPL